MNKKLAASGLVAGALMLPIAGYTADADSNRTSPKAYAKDAMITAKIKAELADEKLSSLVRIRVDTDNRGRVSLSGTAKTQEAADKAVLIAHRIKGVTFVQSTIQVKADQ
jgi:hyperosmotically inducible periplasmic protein